MVLAVNKSVENRGRPRERLAPLFAGWAAGPNPGLPFDARNAMKTLLLIAPDLLLAFARKFAGLGKGRC